MKIKNKTLAAFFNSTLILYKSKLKAFFIIVKSDFKLSFHIIMTN